MAVIIILGVGTILLAALVVGDPGDNLTLIEKRVHTDQSGNRFIRGIIRNNTDGMFAQVELEVSFLNDNNTVLESTFVKTKDLDADTIWGFEVPIIADGATQAQFHNLTCSPGSCHLPARFISLAEE